MQCLGLFQNDPNHSVHIRYHLIQKPTEKTYTWKPTIIEDWKIYFPSGAIWEVKKHRTSYVKRFFSNKKEVLCDGSQLYDGNESIFPFMMTEGQNIYPCVFMCETFGDEPIDFPECI